MNGLCIKLRNRSTVTKFLRHILKMGSQKHLTGQKLHQVLKLVHCQIGDVPFHFTVFLPWNAGVIRT